MSYLQLIDIFVISGELVCTLWKIHGFLSPFNLNITSQGLELVDIFRSTVLFNTK